MDNFYFLGEYGYAFRQLLPFLETNLIKFSLLTWEPVCNIIELLWPHRYDLIKAEGIIGKVDGNLRDCNHYRNPSVIRKVEDLGFKHFFTFDKKHNIFHDDAHRVFSVLKKKLMYGEQKENKRFVSIFPRNRKIQSLKNNITDVHIDWLQKQYPNKEIIGHGFPEERIGLNIRFCKDIYEQINVFNNSEVFLCSSSGLADLALICGCDIILTSPYDSIEKTNPHNCNIKYWKDIQGE
jgi:hypothetical protein